MLQIKASAHFSVVEQTLSKNNIFECLKDRKEKMRSCIYDRMEECSGGCRNCKASAAQCESCGGMDEQLYDSDGRMLCTDCLIDEKGQEFYRDFVQEYAAEFRRFFAEVNEDMLIAEGE